MSAARSHVVEGGDAVGVREVPVRGISAERPARPAADHLCIVAGLDALAAGKR